jgi:hypothetical protein
MMMCLVHYFRYMLQSNHPFVLLRDELQHVRNFLRIQQLCFPNQLSCVIKVPSYLQDTAVLVKIQVEIGGSGTPFKLDYRYNEMQEWIKRREEELGRVQLQIADADTVVAELANAIRLIAHGSGLHRYIYRIELPDSEAEGQWLRKLKADFALIIEEFNRLWLQRNRKGGLSDSNRNLYKLLGQYDERLRELEARQA